MDNDKIMLLAPEYTEARTKILEFANSLDEWEQEVLFGQDGFYSLTGKKAVEKFKDYASELEIFANKKLNELKLTQDDSRAFLLHVKKEKTAFILREMKEFLDNEMQNYAAETTKNTVALSISLAVLHKNNPKFIDMSLQNGLSAVHLLNAPLGHKAVKAAEKQYKSEFYSALIDAFAQDNDINAYYYFDKFKDELCGELEEKFKPAVNELKTNLTAYNYAKELFSYDLPKEKREKELKEIKDEQIKKAVKTYLSEFDADKKRLEDEDKKAKNIENTDKIVSMLDTNADDALLFIDYSLGEETVKFKKEYIRLIKKNGIIKTDADKFIMLLLIFLKDFDEFKKKDLSENIVYLSKSDFEILRKFQSLNEEEYTILKSDFYYIFRFFSETQIKEDVIKREICLAYLSFLKEYEKANKKAADITARNKIISELTTRYTKNERE